MVVTRVTRRSWVWVKGETRRGSSPSLWTFRRVTEGVEMAEARKLAGSVSEESEVTPRRSFSLNIFLQEGDLVKVLVPSCRGNTWKIKQGGHIFRGIAENGH